MPGQITANNVVLNCSRLYDVHMYVILYLSVNKKIVVTFYM